MRRFIVRVGYIFIITLSVIALFSMSPYLWFFFNGYTEGADPVWERAQWWAQWLTPLSYALWVTIPGIFCALYYTNALPGLRYRTEPVTTLHNKNIEGTHV